MKSAGKRPSEEKRGGSEDGMFWVSAVGQRSPKQVGALRSAEGRKQVELSFPVKEEQRCFPRHQLRANWAPVGDTAAS